jgi:SprT protein
MKDLITERVKELCTLANVPYIAPEFGLKGKIAGQFIYKCKTCRLNFNLIFAENHTEEYLARTVTHEVAHYVRYYRNSYAQDLLPSGKRDIHGAKWRAVMKELGATDIKRCHSYDTSVIPGRKYKKFSYACDSGHTYQLTAIRHNRAQKGTMWYNCRECDSRLRFIE